MTRAETTVDEGPDGREREATSQSRMHRIYNMYREFRLRAMEEPVGSQDMAPLRPTPLQS